MDGVEEEEVRTLPEDLVEKILAMVSFPAIFRARCLSKSWLARFSSIAFQKDEVKKCMAASFQKQVGKWSHKWETFSPVFIGKQDFIGYKPASQNWGRLPSLSFLPENFLHDRFNWFLARSHVQLKGTLLYGFAPLEEGSRTFELHVANILTGTWKQLPPRPEIIGRHGRSVLCHTLVIDPLGEKYKLIVFRRSGSSDPDEGSLYSAQIYDSKSGGWISMDFFIPGDFTVQPSPSAYLNGFLYIVSANNPQNLVALNLEEGTLRQLSLAFDDVIQIVSVNVVVCKVNWLMIVAKGLYPETLQVLKIDLESQRLVQLARGPPAALNVRKIIGQPVGDGSCIFFRVEDRGSRVLAYNVDTDEWTCFPVPAPTNAETRYKWIGSSFQPGLSPFTAV